MFRKLGNRGFTVTEMSLVLLLGGMMMGTVMKSDGIMEGFQKQRLANDLVSISAAYYSYFNMYNAMPGDDTRTHGWSNVSSGNSNGYLDGSGASDGSEAHEAWQALRWAGLITGHPDVKGKGVLPRHPYGGPYYFSNRIFGRYGKRNCIIAKNLAGSVAEAIDIQYDDGRYNSGTISGSAAYKGSNVDLFYAL